MRISLSIVDMVFSRGTTFWSNEEDKDMEFSLMERIVRSALLGVRGMN